MGWRDSPAERALATCNLKGFDPSNPLTKAHPGVIFVVVYFQFCFGAHWQCSGVTLKSVLRNYSLYAQRVI